VRTRIAKVNFSKNLLLDHPEGKDTEMKTQLRSGEKLVKEGMASHQRMFDYSGGKLLLTNQRLIFEAGKLNFDHTGTEIELSSLESAIAGWTRLLFIPLFPNLLTIRTKSRETYFFTAYKLREWVSAIDAERSR
jgi:hypothetical protein